jgi:hypothetical protein
MNGPKIQKSNGINKFSLVSHIQFFSKILGDIHNSRCTHGINNTGGKFANGINDTGGKLAIGTTRVVDTGWQIMGTISDIIHLKGSLTRDFLHQIFCINQCLSGP